MKKKEVLYKIACKLPMVLLLAAFIATVSFTIYGTIMLAFLIR